MNTKQIKIAIAESMGWDFDPIEAREWGSRGVWVKPPKGGLVFSHSIPDCCNDLNVMHEVEKAFPEGLKKTYAVKLWNIVLAGRVPQNDEDAWFSYIHATATQRAEAYLKTIGKWEPATQPPATGTTK